MISIWHQKKVYFSGAIFFLLLKKGKQNETKQSDNYFGYCKQF